MTDKNLANDGTPLVARQGPKKIARGSPQPPPPPPNFESLDFDRIINTYSISAAKSRQGGSYDGISLTRWILTCVVGLATGITAVIIVHFVDLLVEFRVTRLNSQMQYVFGSYDEQEMHKYYHDLPFFDTLAQYGLGGIYAFYTGYNCSLVLLSTALCVLFAPMAVGSGIPEVKAYLNGVRVGEFAGMRLYCIKLLGTILGVSSGLVVGPEGPVVHLGAILGASMTKTGGIERYVHKFNKRHEIISGCLGCADRPHSQFAEDRENTEEEKNERCCRRNTLWSSLVYYLSFFRNDLERRHLISIGAAAGFASAFGAPVGGLLYSMEEASSFFSHDLLWKTLTATAIATGCIAVYYGNLTRYSMLSLEIGGTAESLLTQFNEIPLYFTMGSLGGILGATFNNINAFLNKLRKKFYGRIQHCKWKYTLCKLLESLMLSAVTSCLMITVVLTMGICRPAEAADEEFRFIHRYNCAPGEINELGSLIFGSREESIKDVLTDPEAFDPKTLLTLGLLFLGLMMITFGVALPTGMFMPTVLVGASLGGFAGLIIKLHYIPAIHPSDFALIGAAAFLAGSQRNIVSLCVILMEGTGQTKALIPVIMTVICARTVGDKLSEGIYEVLMEIRDYPFLEHESKQKYDIYTAGDVMTATVSTVSMICEAGYIENLLMTTPHSAFPVVEEATGQYRGMVRRDQLIAALECKIYIETLSEDDESKRMSIRSAGSEAGKGWATQVGRDYTLMNRALRIDDGLYRSFRFTRPKKIQASSPDRAQDSSPGEGATTWLEGNLLTSEHDDEIIIADETLPSGTIQKDGYGAVLKKVNGNVAINIPPLERLYHVDVGAIMNRSAFSVQEDCPLSRTFDIFSSMGLRHLPVLHSDGTVIGMITRYNLSDEYVHEHVKHEY